MLDQPLTLRTAIKLIVSVMSAISIFQCFFRAVFYIFDWRNYKEALYDIGGIIINIVVIWFLWWA